MLVQDIERLFGLIFFLEVEHEICFEFSARDDDSFTVQCGAFEILRVSDLSGFHATEQTIFVDLDPIVIDPEYAAIKQWAAP